MPKISIEIRLVHNERKIQLKAEVNNSKSALLPNLQSFQNQIITGNGFILYKLCFSAHEMSSKKFQILDNEPVDNSIMKRDFKKVYHQQRAIQDEPDQDIEIIFGENNIYDQIRNAYLQFGITLRKADNNNFNEEAVRMLKKLLHIVLKKLDWLPLWFDLEGFDLEHKQNVGQLSVIMRLITSEDGDLITYFDKISEKNIDNTCPKQILNTNHKVDANKGKINGQLPVEHIFGFCKSFENLTKNLGFLITLKTIDLQDFLYTTFGDDMVITIKKLHLSFPYLFHLLKQKLCLMNLSRINIQFHLTRGILREKVVNDGVERHIDIGSAQNNNIPK